MIKVIGTRWCAESKTDGESGACDGDAVASMSSGASSSSMPGSGRKDREGGLSSFSSSVFDQTLSAVDVQRTLEPLSVVELQAESGLKLWTDVEPDTVEHEISSSSLSLGPVISRNGRA